MFALVNSLAAAGFAQNDVAKMLSELKKFGANGHLYIPGIGAISGITAGNYLDSIGTTSASVDGNVGLVKDALGGLNATQATTGYQPKLRRGLVNLLLYSNDLMNAAWSIAAGGTKQSANSITFSATNDQLGQTVNTDASVGVSATGAVVLSGAGSIVLVLARIGGGVYEDSALTINLTPTPTLYSVSKTIANAGQTGFRLALVKTAGSTATSITMDGAAVLKGSLTAQQIIAAGGIPLTTTAQASSSAGTYKLEFDGVDDRLLLGSVPFQTSDNLAIVFSGNVASLSASRSLFGAYSAAENNPRIQMYTSLTSGVLTGMIRDDAGASAISTGGSVQSGGNFIASLVKQGATMSVRLNGVAGSIGNTSSLGVATLNTCALCETKGSYSAASVAGVAVIKGTVTAAQALIFERGLNALSQYAAGGF